MIKAYEAKIEYTFERDKSLTKVPSTCKLFFVDKKLTIKIDTEDGTGFEKWKGVKTKKCYPMRLVECWLNGKEEDGTGKGNLVEISARSIFEGNFDQTDYGPHTWRISELKENKSATKLLKENPDLV